MKCHNGNPLTGERSIPSCNSCHASYPHIVGFSSPKTHGPAYLKSSGSCIACHTRPGTLAKSCAACHEGFPHKSGFGDREVHGSAYFKDKSQCLLCHQGEMTEERPVPQCTMCHETFPHSDGFSDPSAHGQAFVKNSWSSCSGCHAEGVTTPNGSAPSCGDCHLRMPHESGFGNPKVHGPVYIQDKSACSGCHTDHGQTGIPTCNTCHQSFPHPTGFNDPTQHPVAFMKSQNTCTACHGEDLSGGGAPDRSCFKCHKTEHTPEFESTRLHGSKFMESGSNCWNCHDTSKPQGGANSSAPQAKRSCAICHENFPHQQDFSDPAQHGNAFFQNPANCAVCHGADFKGRGNSISCQDCHTFPHPKKWTLPSQHGQAFVAEKTPNTPDWKEPLSTCRDCHYKNSGFKQRHPEKFIGCDSCHFFHLEDGYDADVPNGMSSHIYHGRIAKNQCLACHVGGTHLMPHHGDKGCMDAGCHTGKQPIIQWKDADVELAPKSKTTP